MNVGIFYYTVYSLVKLINKFFLNPLQIQLDHIFTTSIRDALVNLRSKFNVSVSAGLERPTKRAEVTLRDWFSGAENIQIKTSIDLLLSCRFGGGRALLKLLLMINDSDVKYRPARIELYKFWARRDLSRRFFRPRPLTPRRAIITGHFRRSEFPGKKNADTESNRKCITGD